VFGPCDGYGAGIPGPEWKFARTMLIMEMMPQKTIAGIALFIVIFIVWVNTQAS